MLRRPPAVPKAFPALWIGLLAWPLGAQTPADPFEAGQRWSQGPAAGEAWIPRDVVFAAGGELVWAAPAVDQPHLALYAAGATLGSEAPLLQGPELVGAIGVVPVAAGAGADQLFAAPQFPAPDLSQRRTEVVCYDAQAAALGAAFAPVWTHVLPVPSNGPALLAADTGGGLVVALHDPADEPGEAAPEVAVQWLDPASGVALGPGAGPGGGAERHGPRRGGAGRPGGGARPVGARRAGGQLASRDDARLDELPGPVAGRQRARGGGFAGARVLVEQGGVFAEAFTIPAGAGEMAATAGASGDGSTVAVGMWNYLTGTGCASSRATCPARPCSTPCPGASPPACRTTPRRSC